MTETPVPGPVPRFELARWRDEFGVVAGITGRGGGEPPFDLGLAGTHTPVERVMGHWRNFQQSFPGFDGVVVARQVHGTEIRWQGPSQGLLIQDDADGHGTGSPRLLLGVTVADCIPVYLVDPGERLVALVHAGWRGVAGGILPLAVELLRAKGSHVENVLVHCGVGICGGCYEVGPEVFAACGLDPPPAGRGELDLRALLTHQALMAGVVHISTSPFCSSHDQDRFFSHRGSGGKDGRGVAFLGLLG